MVLAPLHHVAVQLRARLVRVRLRLRLRLRLRVRLRVGVGALVAVQLGARLSVAVRTTFTRASYVERSATHLEQLLERRPALPCPGG